MTRPLDHPTIQHGKIGVLLVNLGTPEELTVKSVRAYLKEFLSDARVVEIPRLVWWLILNVIILNTRPKRSLAAYAKVWLKEENESPLRYYTRAQAEKLAKAQPELNVDFAMRYGQPSIISKMEKLQKDGCDRILIVPMYPQYSATTNASVTDAVFDHLKTLRWQPTIRIAHPWYSDPAYINALADQIKAHLSQQNSEPDKILLSFHGLPKFSLEKGDPYYCHSQVTGRLLAQALGKSSDDVLITFQSRFGPAKWIEPYTVDTLKALPGLGVKNLLIVTPGFAVDCLETLEEIAMEGVEEFMNAGGTHCEVLPCLNDSPESMVLLSKIVEKETKGWLE
jgi:ferrochelatase